MSENPQTGSSFDDFLKEEGMYETCTASALKRILAWQIEQEMQRQHISNHPSTRDVESGEECWHL